MFDTNEAENQAKIIAVIADQNDRFRKTLGADFAIPGQIVFTPGVSGLSVAAQTAVTHQVQKFNTFTEDNDPHGDHGFGALDLSVDGVDTKFFWKIDLYDAAYEYGSPDPANTAVTRRVLTIMRASEY